MTDDLIFEVPSEPLTFNGKTVHLRGLTLPHIIYLVREHTAVLERLYTKALTGEIQANAEAVAIELAEEFSPLVGKVIACSLGRPEAAEQLGQLPASVQIEALDIVVRLTMAQDGGLEKTLEIVTRAMAAVGKAMDRPEA